MSNKEGTLRLPRETLGLRLNLGSASKTLTGEAFLVPVGSRAQRAGPSQSLFRCESSGTSRSPKTLTPVESD